MIIASAHPARERPPQSEGGHRGTAAAPAKSPIWISSISRVMMMMMMMMMAQTPSLSARLATFRAHVRNARFRSRQLADGELSGASVLNASSDSATQPEDPRG